MGQPCEFCTELKRLVECDVRREAEVVGAVYTESQIGRMMESRLDRIAERLVTLTAE